MVLSLAVIFGIPAFLVLYKAPTCSDGVRNGNEQGVDCGGSCQRLCQSSFALPSVAWARSEQVAPGLYNLAAYIINPNKSGEALNVPYTMTAYDNQGISIVDQSGTVSLPPNRNTLAFSPSVDMGKRIPARIAFIFDAAPDWHKQADSLSALAIGSKSYVEDNTGSSLSVVLSNTSVYDLSNITVYVVLSDRAGNELGFSKTVIDMIPAKQSVTAPFTWPVTRNGKVISIDVLPVAE